MTTTKQVDTFKDVLANHITDAEGTSDALDRVTQAFDSIDEYKAAFGLSPEQYRELNEVVYMIKNDIMADIEMVTA